MTGPVLYVHLAADGGILVIEGDTGRSGWVPVSELGRRLDELSTVGGTVLLSQELRKPKTSPVLELVNKAGVSVVPSRRHPAATRAGRATTLMFAAYVGDVELVQDLLQRGVELETKDDEGFTALMYAANAGQDLAARLLVDAGAEVNQVDLQGSTPLMFAAQQGHLGIVKKLLSSGANVSARRVDGLTARDFAVRHSHERIAGILLSAERQVS